MKIVFATHNENKIKEVQKIVPEGIVLLSLKDIGCTEDIPETGNTLEENAIIKANYITNKYEYDCFADDTGLLVDALNGEPGVYSARYAGEQKNAEDNMDKLLSELKKHKNRTARFKTVIALNLNGKQELFTGAAEGEIIKEKKGDGGFGYDPVFKPTDYNQTFAELQLAVKNKISHRGKAIQLLISYLKK
ncbi:non-canonical purine NTP diphosphatase [Maribacter sp. HTCC2170]|uniref:non-canonical purine NTP diphosphatase n=1 Tax=Maribacter sp. (strain HTCC2170 / KCCM 42371) TaxID=313603 RepID=UPI00006B473B|nr:non-canonical purine NTP diphosphatase [Maribacter sp. HTCC2170]EAR01582.1 putative xanthosine triphosphate pyrophosphatase [Maribacter sp. HTCC2170]